MSTQPPAAIRTLLSGALRDAVLSPNGRTVYVSNSEGFVTALDTATAAVVGRWKVGVVGLAGMDVSPDGKFLIVPEAKVEGVRDLNNDVGTARIHMLDLTTGAIRDFTISVGISGRAFYDAAFMSDGKVLLTTSFSDFAVLDPTAGSFIRPPSYDYSPGGTISVTDDHQRLLLNMAIPSGGLQLYTPDGGLGVSYTGHADGIISSGIQAISPDGSQIAQFLKNLYVFDANLKLIQNVSDIQPTLVDFFGKVAGVEFSADGKSLYVLDSSADHILQLSTATWAVESSFSLGIDVKTDRTSIPAEYGDRLMLSPDGARLIVLGNDNVLSVALDSVVRDGGTDRADIVEGGPLRDQLYGYREADVIRGYDGDDVLDGGPGDDHLDGGAGNDLLIGGAGSDTADYGSAASGVSLDFNRLSQVAGSAGQDSFYEIENLAGSAFDDHLTGDALANRLEGRAGDDILDGGPGDDVLDGGAGVDTASYQSATGGLKVSLGVSGVQNTEGGGLDLLTSIENLEGSTYADTLTGDASDNVLTGAGGNDVLDGGAGIDTAVFSGRMGDYRWDIGSVVRLTDLRAGSPDGSDLVMNIEVLRFSDRQVAADDRGAAVIAIDSVLRGPDAGLQTELTTGGFTAAQSIARVVQAAAATTSVATLSYQFFTGKAPTEGGVDYLVAADGPNPNNLNSPYYQHFNLENRYINFAVNLGRDGEGKAAFAERYGPLSLFEATREAYHSIFGGTPTDAKVNALIEGRADYFLAYGQTEIGAKAAMVGWLLAEAEKADVGVMARSNDAFLTDLADGFADKGFAVDLLSPGNGYYSPDFIFAG